MPTTLTPSDSSRRVDHEEFMRGAVPPTRGADNPDETSPPSPRRRAGPSTNPIPRSFAYGAPSDASSVIPPSSSRTLVNTLGRPNINSNTVNTSNPNSSGAPLKDTSVRIANAIAEASMAGSTQSQSGPSGTSYASSSTLLNASQNPSSSNSLRPPPSNPPRPRKGGKPVSVGSSSSHHAAEYDEDYSQRGKRGLSPVEELSAVARQKSPFFISLREANAAGSNYQSMSAILAEQQQQGHTEEPSRQSLDDTQIESRDYESESDIFTDLKQNASRKATKPRSRHKGSTGNDNQAYRPSSDAEESSDDDASEGGRRRKKKRDTARHLLDGSLPMVSAEKRRKNKGSGRKSGVSSRKAVDEANGSGASHSPSRNTSPRDQGDNDEPSVEYQDDPSVIDLTNEIPPPAPEEEAYNQSLDSASGVPYSVGEAMGLSFHQFASYFGVAGRLLQLVIVAMFETLLARPMSWFRSGSLPGLSRVLVIISTIAAIVALQQSFSSSSSGTSSPARGGFFSSIFGRPPPRRPVFQPPSDLPDNWDQFTSQFTSMQVELAALSDHVQRVDDATIVKSLQHQLTMMSRRADDADAKLQGLISEVHDAMSGISKRLDRQPSVTDGFHKVDLTLERMHEWIRRIETLAEATAPQLHELEKKVATLPIVDMKTRSRGRGPQDVTPGIIEFFEQLLLRASKDRLALADYAIYSGGGRIIPSLTSPTYEIRIKRSWLASVAGFGETNGPQGRPPVTALVPDINVGNCWPFKGSTGTLGVYLSRHVYVSSITIDHVAKEVTYDITPAPKRVRVWGVVDGADNLAKFATYRDELENRKEAGTLTQDELEEMETPLPSDMPRSLEFVPLARVDYDPSALDNVQTFPVPDRIQRLGIDVGIVLFDVQSNWGHPDFTCIYRVRVHGAARDTSQPPKISESLKP